MTDDSNGISGIVSTEGMDRAQKDALERVTRKWVDHFISNVSSEAYEEVIGKMTPDAHFVLLGHTPASGSFTKEECYTKLAPEYARYEVRPTIEFSHVMVDGDQAFLRAKGQGVGRYGPYSQPYYGYWFRAVEDGYADIIEFNDPTEMETKLFGRKILPTEAA